MRLTINQDWAQCQISVDADAQIVVAVNRGHERCGARKSIRSSKSSHGAIAAAARKETWRISPSHQQMGKRHRGGKPDKRAQTLRYGGYFARVAFDRQGRARSPGNCNQCSRVFISAGAKSAGGWRYSTRHSTYGA